LSFTVWLQWPTLTVTIYGRTVTTQVRTVRALWYTAWRGQLVQIVLVRDPTGKRRDEAFFRTDPTADARFVLEAYARQWCLEVTFHDAQQFLGFAEPQCQTPRAVQRAAPFALLVYDLVLLWFAEHAHSPTSPTWLVRPWYRRKTAPPLWICSPLSGAPWPPPAFWSQRALHRGAQTRQRHRQTAISGSPNGGSRV